MSDGRCTRVFLLLMMSAVSPSLWAQSPDARRARQLQQRLQQQIRAAAENQPELPSDPQLLSIHREFIAKTEKLAAEYERKKQYEQARQAYESLVRLVPKYGPAETGLQRVLNNQSLKDKKLATVAADQLWQDSGVSLIEGMPVHVEVKGTWKVVYETGPKGIVIPDEMKPHDHRIKLGSLIAVIADSPNDLAEAKPFVIEGGNDFIAKKSGRLYLRMFDVDPSDNEGKMFVLIQSTFSR
ncbi:MAG: hypothetical protein MI861_12430 [Pirellulales bacterium]|nr:hypothetical protein [Pirellulales bacterium]